MKILFLSSWYPNRLNPLLGNFVMRHAEAVSGFNDVSSLYVCSDPNLNDKTFELEINNSDNVYSVNVYYKKIQSNIPLISLMLKYLRNRRAYYIGYKKILEHFGSKPDIVHVNVAFPAGLFAMYLKRKYKIPYIVTEHSTQYHLTMDSKVAHLIKRICAKAEVVCPVSTNLKMLMQKKGFGETFEVVPNVVNTELFYPSNAKRTGKKKIIHISTLSEEQKNISGILRVIQKLSKTRNDFELLIISEKDTSGAINQSEKLGLSESVVHFYPVQALEKVAEMLRHADVFLLFSNFENLPCVIIEALASGVPVVSSNVGGINEHINDENGMLVNPKDEDALFEKLNIILDNPAFFQKEKMRDYAVKNFSYNVIGQKFNDIYKQIVR